MQSIANLTPEKKRALLEQMLREKAGRAKPIPLSSAQTRLWFLDKLEPNSALYNIPTVLRLRGSLNVEALRHGLNRIVERHAALRTRIVTADEHPAQQVAPATDVPWNFADLSSRPVYERQVEANELIQRECKRSFDLANDLMIRATLVRLSADEHLLAIVTHHIASDEWSLRVLFNELTALYKAGVESSAPTLPELPIQYTDYATWQQEWLRSEPFQKQLGYWKEQLNGGLPRLDLPTDQPRRGGQTYRGALARRTMPRDLVAGLKQFSRANDATLFMTLLSAFQALLHRYTGLEDVIVGSPIAGRTRTETDGLIGFFVNTLALRARVTDGITFRDLLRQVRETTLNAYANQDAPFDKVVEELHPDRNGSGAPLVQALFALNNEYSGALDLPGLTSEFIEIDTQTSKFELTLVVTETAKGLEAVAEYNVDLFHSSTIDRWLGHFEMLLRSALEQPDGTVAQLNILTQHERNQIVHDWNATKSDYPREATIHQLFDAQAEATPRAVAAEFQGKTITYQELQSRANQLANHLRTEGAGDHALIGLAVERSIDMLVGMLGILKAGAAYVPLDPSYPRERLSLMIEDTRMPLMVAQAHLAREFAHFPLKAVLLDGEPSWTKTASPKTPPNANRAEDLAYVIYTSGSTGKPKGACVPHRGVVRLLFNTDYVQLSNRDRIAQASNASFDAATFEIWGALLHGGRLVGIDKETALAPEAFAERLRKEKVSALFVTTALFNQLASAAPGVFESINTVMFGGEAVDPKWVRSVLANRPPRRLLHVYGPTESTTFTTWHEVKEVRSSSSTVPIGKPIANTEVYLLDKMRSPVPVGIPGELYVGGDGLAIGYLNRPELTAEKFVDNPFGPAGSKLYRTGDLGRFRTDGSIDFVGRIDNQVKIRGFRIELGEIESVLSSHPSVKECAVLAREDTSGEKRLVAYLVPKSQPAPLGEDLRAFLKQKLPDYMAPSAFVVLDKMPLTPNEKIDRKALPAPDSNRSQPGKNFMAPRDATEQQLTKIWEKALGVQPIGINDNFFDLGGHSLLAVKVFASIEKHFGKKLPLATLFKAPTVAEVAQILREESSEEKSWNVIVDLQPNGSKPPIFWVHSLGGDGGGAFFYYRKLAELLGADQPSYGIRSPQQPFDSIEGMASHYVAELRKVQPDGPYHIGGFCFGGNVAYEVARQLREQGDEVALLALLESSPPYHEGRKVKLSAEAATFCVQNVYAALKEFAGKDRAEQQTALRKKTKRIRERVKARLFGDENGTESEPALNEVIDLANYPKDYVKYAETHWHALRRYHPKGYGGTIHLFRARKQPLSARDPSLGWDSLAPSQVKVVVIPGNHETIVQEPNVQVLAVELTRALDEAHKRSDQRNENNATPAIA